MGKALCRPTAGPGQPPPSLGGQGTRVCSLGPRAANRRPNWTAPAGPPRTAPSLLSESHDKRSRACQFALKVLAVVGPLLLDKGDETLLVRVRDHGEGPPPGCLTQPQPCSRRSRPAPGTRLAPSKLLNDTEDRLKGDLDIGHAASNRTATEPPNANPEPDGNSGPGHVCETDTKGLLSLCAVPHAPRLAGDDAARALRRQGDAAGVPRRRPGLTV